jgi:hypothetical protein
MAASYGCPISLKTTIELHLLVGTQTAAYTESVPAKSRQRIIMQSPTADTRKTRSRIAF